MQLSLGLFGKLPTANDFVRLCADGEPFESLDRWLVACTEWAHHHGGDAWRRAFAVGASYAFVYQAPQQKPPTLLVGVLGPSTDGAGRQFPLCVAAPYVGAAASFARPELLPVVFEALWQKTSNTLSDCRGLAPASLPGSLGPSDVELCPLDEAEATYRDWTEKLAPQELWTLLYGPGFGEQPILTLRVLAEALRPHRGVERPTTPLSVWLPLGQTAGASVCVWLDIIKRLAGWRKTVPNLFWSHNGTDGRLLLHLGNPPPSTLGELWLPSGTRDEIFDVASHLDVGSLVNVPELPEAMTQRMTGARSIADFLQALGTG